MLTLDVDVTDWRFMGPRWDSTARGVVLAWRGDTGLANLVALRLVVFGFSWPPIRWADTLVPTDSTEGSQ